MSSNKRYNAIMHASDPVIKVKNVKLLLAGQWIHCGINLEVQHGEIIGIVGGSGSGKSTLLREILALLTPTSGEIEVFGKNLSKLSAAELLKIQCRWRMFVGYGPYALGLFFRQFDHCKTKF